MTDNYWHIFKRGGTPVLVNDGSIDALTVTSSVKDVDKRVHSKLAVRELFDAIRATLFEDDDLKTIGSGNGKSVWQQGKVKYTRTQANSKVEIKGEGSTDAFELCLSYQDDELKITRIDLCTDVEIAVPDSHILRELYDRMPGKRRDKSRLIVSEQGDTLYIMSRESPTFARIYDKSNAYGKCLGSVYRFELEIKQVKAERVKVALRKCEDMKEFIRSTVCKQFERWDIPYPVKFQTDVTLPVLEAGVTTSEMQLRWLSRQVRGTVDSLKQKGLLPEALHSLGVTSLDIGKVKLDTFGKVR